MRIHNNPAVTLPVETATYRTTRQQLLADFPDLDDETLHDTLEGITDLKQMLAEVVRSALDDEALAGGLSTRLSDMKARLGAVSKSAGSANDSSFCARWLRPRSPS